MCAIILDTETHDLKNGLPVQIAYGEFSFTQGKMAFNKEAVIDQYYSIGDQKISIGAMSVHHILDEDLQDKPLFTEFCLPESVEYIVGHNIDFDIDVIKRCRKINPDIKSICTLSLARYIWPELTSHTLAALIYYITPNRLKSRDLIKNAHSARADIVMTANLLYYLIQHLNVRCIEELFQRAEEVRVPTRIYFGKHKGKTIAELPSGYIKWLLEQSDTDKYLKQAIFIHHPKYKQQIQIP